MKRFVEGVDRGQSTLFPDRLEDWIGDDNPVRLHVLAYNLNRVMNIMGIGISRTPEEEMSAISKSGHRNKTELERAIPPASARRAARRYGPGLAGVGRKARLPGQVGRPLHLWQGEGAR